MCECVCVCLNDNQRLLPHIVSSYMSIDWNSFFLCIFFVWIKFNSLFEFHSIIDWSKFILIWEKGVSFENRIRCIVIPCFLVPCKIIILLQTVDYPFETPFEVKKNPFQIEWTLFSLEWISFSPNLIHGRLAIEIEFSKKRCHIQKESTIVRPKEST